MTEANLSIIKIEAEHCYMCGEQLQDKIRTLHHSIPRFHKPKRNILIPVCQKCHSEINKYTVQSVPKLEALDNFVKGMENFLTKYKKVMERHGKNN